MFKVGDKVRRKKEFREDFWWKGLCRSYGLTLDNVFVVKEVGDCYLLLDKCGRRPSPHNMEIVPNFSLDFYLNTGDQS
jgi:hypothetical protein